MSIFSIIMSIIKAINDYVEMTLLVHLLQYWLHLSGIMADNDQYQLPISLSVHH